MIREVTIVPKGKHPLAVLSEVGEKLRHSWIFIHENVFENLSERKESQSYISGQDEGCVLIRLEATSEHPKAEILCEEPATKGWGEVIHIQDETIAFSFSFKDPEHIFFLKMEE